MKLCRFISRDDLNATRPRVGMLTSDDHVLDLSSEGIDTLASLLEFESLLSELERFSKLSLPHYPLDTVRLLAPVDRQEVWAAGVTYLRSKKARMEESDFSANAYDRVYDAPRPEIFFKSLPEKVVGPGCGIGIRQDARWNVPEPELVLVLNSRKHLVGYSIGNDMSSRDIEGENLLYLPQAKTYHKSCAMGPCIVVGASESVARDWSIQIEIKRDGVCAFKGDTKVAQIKRTFAELIDYLTRSQNFPHGVCLLTGTGIVPGDNFTLKSGDQVDIEISGIGRLSNHVEVV